MAAGNGMAARLSKARFGFVRVGLSHDLVDMERSASEDDLELSTMFECICDRLATCDLDLTFGRCRCSKRSIMMSDDGTKRRAPRTSPSTGARRDGVIGSKCCRTVKRRLQVGSNHSNTSTSSGVRAIERVRSTSSPH